MKTSYQSKGIILLFCFCAAALILGGCGGGGGSDFFSAAGSANTGTVALSLTDGPTEDYEHITIWVNQVSLQPADNGGPAVVIFKSKDPEGYPVDLLDLRDRDDSFLLSVKKKVPAGKYAKIRLGISKILAEGDGECDGTYIKLPSNEIKLNPRDPFWVKKGETISIQLDVDAQRSLLHKAGNSGKCIFSPTVFIDIETIKFPEQRCPQNLAGEIKELTEDSIENVIGFKLALKETWYTKDKHQPLPEERDVVDVLLSDDPETKIFDEEGLAIEPNDLKDKVLPQMALVRGRINHQGDVIASMVVLGGVQMFKGTVTDSDPDNNQFILQLINDGPLIIDYTDETLILTDCNTEGKMIPIGSKVRVYGKFVKNGDLVQNTFRAVVVEIKEQNMSWTLVRMDKETDGYNLILKELGEDSPVFLPEKAPISFKGDGPIIADELADLVNCAEDQLGIPRQVEIVFENGDVASNLLVIMEDLKTEVEGILNEDDMDLENNIILYDSGKRILVSKFATIYRHQFVIDKLGDTVEIKGAFIDFKEIIPGDKIQAFGLEACPNFKEGIGEINFFARVVIVKTETDKKDGDFGYDDDDDDDDNH